MPPGGLDFYCNKNNQHDARAWPRLYSWPAMPTVGMSEFTVGIKRSVANPCLITASQECRIKCSPAILFIDNLVLMIFMRFFCCLCLLALFIPNASGQDGVFEKPRLTVADGLPQSYVSGLVQDAQGFVWIATRDGLARYDGKKFKTIRHRPGDTSSLAANVIVNLFLDRALQLWIQYEDGEIDILHTGTERLFHLTRDAVYKGLFSRIKHITSIVQDDQNRYWLPNDKNSGIFIVDLQNHQLHFYSNEELGLAGNPVTGIAKGNGFVMLATDTAIISMSLQQKIIHTLPYKIPDPHLFDPEVKWKDNSPIIRKNGDIVIMDENRIIIYQSAQKNFITRSIPPRKLYVRPARVEDDKGNILFGHDGDIYILDNLNELRIWKAKANGLANEESSSMLFDRSHVLWVGTNGYYLRQFDLRLPRMPQDYYRKNFPEDIFQKYLHVLPSEINKSPLHNINPYFFRWVQEDNGKIWMSQAGVNEISAPNICYYKNGSITTNSWHYTDTITGRHNRISALAVSRSGKLWGLDNFLRLIRLDTVNQSATIVSQVLDNKINRTGNVNSMVVDGEKNFWITTSFKLIKYDMGSGKFLEFKDVLPVSEFTVLTNDPVDRHILWIGTLGGGLIKMNTLTYEFRIYTVYDGLPNNTVYAILPVKGQLWCSSNKGIFSFNPQNGFIRSYTTLDGLPVDEFNRFHFLQLPDHRLAFGGTNGYTVFDPHAINSDTFEPAVALTGLKINNREADYGSPGSPLGKAVNSLDTLILSYRKNFLVFEFAAFEYNIPEKLNYRYIMENLDDQWIEAGANNSATYTDLHPGHYVFKVNATNTAGNWSRHIKAVVVIIDPPFWLTWWFITLCVVVTGGLVLLFIRLRMVEIRKQEQQKHRFEKEAVDLQAQALRAQMNPHFIFNCLNSIKALIQENKNQKAVIYLTAFSKLIRSKLNNTGQEISLYNEIETCKLYVQMESLRFENKITCDFIVDDTIDTHAIMVPPLFLQPLIENAFWHGILPLQTKGDVTVTIERQGDYLYCSVEDNGIGREQSMSHKSRNNLSHQSKGMQLIEDRLRLHNNNSQAESSIEVIDKKDGRNLPTGTLVIIKFKLPYD
jgi:ligand-binding sensor domain-containing protein